MIRIMAFGWLNTVIVLEHSGVLDADEDGFPFFQIETIDLAPWHFGLNFFAIIESGQAELRDRSSAMDFLNDHFEAGGVEESFAADFDFVRANKREGFGVVDSGVTFEDHFSSTKLDFAFVN